MSDTFDRTIELKISGMTCGHCVSHVEEELKALDHVTQVSTILESKGTSTVTVVTNEDIDDAVLREAVDEAGDYTVEAIIR